MTLLIVCIMNDEVYIYIGKKKETLFFTHQIVNTNVYDIAISKQLYVILMNEQIIKHHSNNVVIFDKDPRKQMTDVVIIQHLLNKQRLVIDKNNLREIERELNELGNGLYCIKYNYEHECYYSDILPKVSVETSVKTSVKTSVQTQSSRQFIGDIFTFYINKPFL